MIKKLNTNLKSISFIKSTKTKSINTLKKFHKFLLSLNLFIILIFIISINSKFTTSKELCFCPSSPPENLSVPKNNNFQLEDVVINNKNYGKLKLINNIYFLNFYSQLIVDVTIPKNNCPVGYKIPSSSELENLVNYSDGYNFLLSIGIKENEFLISSTKCFLDAFSPTDYKTYMYFVLYMDPTTKSIILKKDYLFNFNDSRVAKTICTPNLSNLKILKDDYDYYLDNNYILKSSAFIENTILKYEDKTLTGKSIELTFESIGCKVLHQYGLYSQNSIDVIYGCTIVYVIEKYGDENPTNPITGININDIFYKKLDNHLGTFATHYFFNRDSVVTAPKSDNGAYVTYSDVNNVCKLIILNQDLNIIHESDIGPGLYPLDIVETSFGFAIYLKSSVDNDQSLLRGYNVEKNIPSLRFNKMIMNNGDLPTSIKYQITFYNISPSTNEPKPIAGTNVMFANQNGKLAFGRNRISLIFAHYNHFGLYSNGSRNDHTGDTLYTFDINGENENYAWGWNTSHSLYQAQFYDGRFFITAALGDVYPENIEVCIIEPDVLISTEKDPIRNKNVKINSYCDDNMVTPGKIPGDARGNCCGRLGGIFKINNKYIVSYMRKACTITSYDGSTTSDLNGDFGIMVFEIEYDYLADYSQKIKMVNKINRSIGSSRGLINIRSQKYGDKVLLLLTYNDSSIEEPVSSHLRYIINNNDYMKIMLIDIDGNILTESFKYNSFNVPMTADLNVLKDGRVFWSYLDFNTKEIAVLSTPRILESVKIDGLSCSSGKCSYNGICVSPSLDKLLDLYDSGSICLSNCPENQCYDTINYRCKLPSSNYLLQSNNTLNTYCLTLCPENECYLDNEYRCKDIGSIYNRIPKTTKCGCSNNYCYDESKKDCIELDIMTPILRTLSSDACINSCGINKCYDSNKMCIFPNLNNLVSSENIGKLQCVSKCNLNECIDKNFVCKLGTVNNLVPIINNRTSSCVTNCEPNECYYDVFVVAYLKISKICRSPAEGYLINYLNDGSNCLKNCAYDQCYNNEYKCIYPDDKDTFLPYKKDGSKCAFKCPINMCRDFNISSSTFNKCVFPNANNILPLSNNGGYCIKNCLYGECINDQYKCTLSSPNNLIDSSNSGGYCLSKCIDSECYLYRNNLYQCILPKNGYIINPDGNNISSKCFCSDNYCLTKSFSNPSEYCIPTGTSLYRSNNKEGNCTQSCNTGECLINYSCKLPSALSLLPLNDISNPECLASCPINQCYDKNTFKCKLLSDQALVDNIYLGKECLSKCPIDKCYHKNVYTCVYPSPNYFLNSEKTGLECLQICNDDECYNEKYMCIKEDLENNIFSTSDIDKSCFKKCSPGQCRHESTCIQPELGKFNSLKNDGNACLDSCEENACYNTNYNCILANYNNLITNNGKCSSKCEVDQCYNELYKCVNPNIDLLLPFNENASSDNSLKCIKNCPKDTCEYKYTCIVPKINSGISLSILNDGSKCLTTCPTDYCYNGIGCIKPSDPLQNPDFKYKLLSNKSDDSCVLSCPINTCLFENYKCISPNANNLLHPNNQGEACLISCPSLSCLNKNENKCSYLVQNNLKILEDDLEKNCISGNCPSDRCYINNICVKSSLTNLLPYNLDGSACVSKCYSIFCIYYYTFENYYKCIIPISQNAYVPPEINGSSCLTKCDTSISCADTSSMFKKCVYSSETKIIPNVQKNTSLFNCVSSCNNDECLNSDNNIYKCQYSDSKHFLPINYNGGHCLSTCPYNTCMNFEDNQYKCITPSISLDKTKQLLIPPQNYSVDNKCITENCPKGTCISYNKCIKPEIGKYLSIDDNGGKCLIKCPSNQCVNEYMTCIIPSDSLLLPALSWNIDYDSLKCKSKCPKDYCLKDGICLKGSFDNLLPFENDGSNCLSECPKETCINEQFKCTIPNQGLLNPLYAKYDSNNINYNNSLCILECPEDTCQDSNYNCVYSSENNIFAYDKNNKFCQTKCEENYCIEIYNTNKQEISNIFRCIKPDRNNLLSLENFGTKCISFCNTNTCIDTISYQCIIPNDLNKLYLPVLNDGGDCMTTCPQGTCLFEYSCIYPTNFKVLSFEDNGSHCVSKCEANQCIYNKRCVLPKSVNKLLPLLRDGSNCLSNCPNTRCRLDNKCVIPNINNLIPPSIISNDLNTSNILYNNGYCLQRCPVNTCIDTFSYKCIYPDLSNLLPLNNEGSECLKKCPDNRCADYKYTCIIPSSPLMISEDINQVLCDGVDIIDLISIKDLEINTYEDLNNNELQEVSEDINLNIYPESLERNVETETEIILIGDFSIAEQFNEQLDTCYNQYISKNFSEEELLLNKANCNNLLSNVNIKQNPKDTNLNIAESVVYSSLDEIKYSYQSVRGHDTCVKLNCNDNNEDNCDITCGLNGICSNGICYCKDYQTENESWTGNKCSIKKNDIPYLAYSIRNVWKSLEKLLNIPISDVSRNNKSSLRNLEENDNRFNFSILKSLSETVKSSLLLDKNIEDASTYLMSVISYINTNITRPDISSTLNENFDVVIKLIENIFKLYSSNEHKIKLNNYIKYLRSLNRNYVLDSPLDFTFFDLSSNNNDKIIIKNVKKIETVYDLLHNTGKYNENIITFKKNKLTSDSKNYIPHIDINTISINDKNYSFNDKELEYYKKFISTLINFINNYVKNFILEYDINKNSNKFDNYIIKSSPYFEIYIVKVERNKINEYNNFINKYFGEFTYKDKFNANNRIDYIFKNNPNYNEIYLSFVSVKPFNDDIFNLEALNLKSYKLKPKHDKDKVDILTGFLNLNFYDNEFNNILFDENNLNLPSIEYSFVLNRYLNGINFYLELNKDKYFTLKYDKDTNKVNTENLINIHELSKNYITMPVFISSTGIIDPYYTKEERISNMHQYIEIGYPPFDNLYNIYNYDEKNNVNYSNKYIKIRTTNLENVYAVYKYIYPGNYDNQSNNFWFKNYNIFNIGSNYYRGTISFYIFMFSCYISVVTLLILYSFKNYYHDAYANNILMEYHIEKSVNIKNISNNNKLARKFSNNIFNLKPMTDENHSNNNNDNINTEENLRIKHYPHIKCKVNLSSPNVVNSNKEILQSPINKTKYLKTERKNQNKESLNELIVQKLEEDCNDNFKKTESSNFTDSDRKKSVDTKYVKSPEKKNYSSSNRNSLKVDRNNSPQSLFSYKYRGAFNDIMEFINDYKNYYLKYRDTSIKNIMKVNLAYGHYSNIFSLFFHKYDEDVDKDAYDSLFYLVYPNYKFTIRLWAGQYLNLLIFTLLFAYFPIDTTQSPSNNIGYLVLFCFIVLIINNLVFCLIRFIFKVNYNDLENMKIYLDNINRIDINSNYNEYENNLNTFVNIIYVIQKKNFAKSFVMLLVILGSFGFMFYKTIGLIMVFQTYDKAFLLCFLFEIIIEFILIDLLLGLVISFLTSIKNKKTQDLGCENNEFNRFTKILIKFNRYRSCM